MNSLPSFDLSDYSCLLGKLDKRNIQIDSVRNVGEKQVGTLYLRHDVDFSVRLAVEMARVEHQLGVRSAYYILLSGPHNVLHPASVDAIKELVSLGHDIGLHYDLKNYPSDEKEQVYRLEKELELLSYLAGVPVETIVMHEPFRGEEDIFLHNNKGLINPAKYQNDHGVLYVSDSCRAWRDTTLMDFVQGKTQEKILQLNTHPESWLATKNMHRLTYLKKVLLPRVNQFNDDYFLNEVARVWITHHAVISGFGDEDEN